MSHTACISLYQSSGASRVKGQIIWTLTVALGQIQTLRYALAATAIFIGKEWKRQRKACLPLIMWRSPFSSTRDTLWLVTESCHAKPLAKLSVIQWDGLQRPLFINGFYEPPHKSHDFINELTTSLNALTDPSECRPDASQIIQLQRFPPFIFARKVPVK